MPLFSFEGREPDVSPSAWIAPTATLIGDVRVEAEASVWYGAVLRADSGPIVIRRGANVQDGTIMHGDGDPLMEVGEGATIGHLCMVHGAVEDRGTVADQRLGMDDAAVHHAQVTNGRALADLGDRVVAAVQHRPILDVRALADDNRPEIGPQHGPVPDRGLRLHPHVADQGGRGRDPCLRADLGLAAFKAEEWHLPIMHLGHSSPRAGPGP